MNREQKAQAIETLKEKFASSSFFYITDSSALNVGQVNDLRQKCFENDIEMQVVKNTLVKKALEETAADKGYEGLYEVLSGPTALMFSNVANAPAKVIKEFRKSHDKPVIKAAYIDSDIFMGDESLAVLADMKSKEDLLGEVIVLLQSPIKTVIGSLNSGGNTIAGLVKALQERA